MKRSLIAFSIISLSFLGTFGVAHALSNIVNTTITRNISAQNEYLNASTTDSFSLPPLATTTTQQFEPINPLTSIDSGTNALSTYFDSPYFDSIDDMFVCNPYSINPAQAVPSCEFMNNADISQPENIGVAGFPVLTLSTWRQPLGDTTYDPTYYASPLVNTPGDSLGQIQYYAFASSTGGVGAFSAEAAIGSHVTGTSSSNLVGNLDFYLNGTGLSAYPFIAKSAVVTFQGTAGTAGNGVLVGIGTTTPQAALTVSEPGQSTFPLFQIASTSGAQIVTTYANGETQLGPKSLSSIPFGTLFVTPTSTTSPAAVFEGALTAANTQPVLQVLNNNGTKNFSVDSIGDMFWGTTPQATLIPTDIGEGQTSPAFFFFDSTDAYHITDLFGGGGIQTTDTSENPDFLVSPTTGNTEILDSKKLGIGTTTPGTLFSIGNTGASTINIIPTATSTFGFGLNIRNGCYAVNGICVGGGVGTNYFTNVGATTTLNTGSELDAGSFVGTSTAPSTFLGNVGIGVSSPKGVLTIPNANFYSLTRTIPTTVGTEVDIGSFTLTNGSGNFEIWINVPSTGYSQSKRYFLPASFTPVAWATVLPIGTTGIYNATNDMDLDIQNSSGVTSFRLIRTAGTTAGTAQIVIEQEGAITDPFTPSTATSATTIPTTIYGATTLTQLNGHTGVNVATPTHGLDVEQDGIPGSANVIQTLTDNALFSGTGDSGTSEALQFNTIGYNGNYVFNIPAASITAIKENSWNLVSGGAENESIGFNTVGGGTFSQKAVLTSLGRLGIGTSSPYQTLSVTGNEALTGALYDSTASPGANGYLLQSTGSATKWVSSTSTPTTGIASSADLTAQTAGTNITTYAVPSGTNHQIQVGGYINVTAVTLDVVQFQVTYTDENSSSQTAIFFPQGLTSANIGSTGDYTLSAQDLRVKGGTTIMVKTTLTTGTGSIAYDAGGFIQIIN